MKRIPLFVFFLLALGASAQNSLQKRLDSLTSAYEATGYHGVILIANGENILYEKGYGLANFEKKIKNTPNTEFKTESVGKMFTAVAILQLVEQGKLKLDQTVKELLPELKIRNADKITIHQLLTHTSGLQSPWDHTDWKFKKAYSKEELMKIVEEVPLAFDTPGKEMFYSNSGYMILSWIVEKISGKPFDQYYKQNVFAKAGMQHTRQLMDTIMPVKTGAQPYRIVNSKRYIKMDETVGPTASGAGGWVSTAHDLYKFMLAIYENKLIKPETWKMMQTANGNAPKDSSYRYYAYGLETYVNSLLKGVSLYGHNGGGAGFSVDAYIDPSTGYIITSCTNLYQNTRPIITNYLSAVMGRPLQEVRPFTWVMVYDAINEKGIDSFIANGKENLKDLKINLHPGMFAQVADAFEAAKDYTILAKWMDFAATIYPEETFLMMLRGDSKVKIGHKDEAKKLYLAARELSTKRNEQWLTNLIDQKMKSL